MSPVALAEHRSRPAAPGGSRARGPQSTVPGGTRAVLELADELVRLEQSMRRLDERLGQDSRATPVERSLLLDLFAHGPRSMAALARARAVSRQSVRETVGRLEAEGRVVRLPNPAHRRAALIALSESGRSLALALLRREARFYRGMHRGLGSRRLATALRVLRDFRTFVDVRLDRT